MNKNRSNLVLSLLSLVITSFLLVFTIYSWYTSNQEVKASGIVASTAGENFDFRLRYWDGSSWKVVNQNLRYEGWLPGTTTYYELKLSNTDSSSAMVNVDFTGVNSSVNNEYVKATYDGTSGGYIKYNGVNAYKYTGNPVGQESAYVRVDTVSASNQALYKITENKVGSNINYIVSAETLKIENGFRWQYIGESENATDETLHTGAITDIDDITEDDYIYDLSTPLLEDYEIVGNTSFYYYFAITFLDDDDMDRFYMYQDLFIEAITISKSRG